jgi:predicted permease
MFSLVAGAAGLILAYWAIGFANSLRLPLDYQGDFGLTLDRTALLFTVGLAVLTGVVFGLAPALQASKPEMVSALKGEITQEPGSKNRLINSLVVAQMTLSILLLVSSGLFLRGLQAATAVDKGFDSDNLLLASVDPGLQGYDRERAEAFYRELEVGLKALPGVEAVGLGRSVPLSLSSSDRGVSIPGYEPAPNERMSINYNIVTLGYFAAMGIPTLAGRTFGEVDGADGAPVLIVNQKFAERFWPGGNALGQIVRTAGEDREVIGVVKTGKYRSLGEDPTDFMYLAQAQNWTFPMTVHVRTSGDPESLALQLRREVERLDPAMPVADLRTMNNQLGVALFPARLGGATLGIFGILGMILAAIGTYSVIAYSVSQRLREIGIRMALGADQGRVVGMVIRKGMVLVAVGVMLGLAASLGASRLMAGMIYGVSPVDPVTFLGVPSVLCLVALVATFIPARRAAAVDPMQTLRAE